MAQYAIDRACGHTETIQIYGTDRWGRRDWIAKKEATRPCAGCVANISDTARAAQAQTSASEAADLSLPELTGSPQQSAWALTIRSDALRALDTFRLEIGRPLGQNPDLGDRADALADALDRELRNHTDARWWIDHRDHAARRIRRAAITTVKEAGRCDSGT